MGEFLQLDSLLSSKGKFGIDSGEKPQSIYLQFIPAVVTNVIYSSDDVGYDGPSSVNTIFVKKHVGEMLNYKQFSGIMYYPLLRGICDTPIKGDSVLVLENEAGQNYYLGPLNSLNNPNFNIDPLNTVQGQKNKDTKKGDLPKGYGRDKLNIPLNYPVVPLGRLTVNRNKKLDDPEGKRKGEDGSIAKEEAFGDMIFEGRYGNSIRLGYRSTNPLIFISNGRNIGETSETFVDSSLISMTTKGKLDDHLWPGTPYLNFILGSENPVLENPRLVGGGNPDPNGGINGKFNYDYGNNEDGTPILAGQTLINSDRLVFNARKDTITLSAFGNLDMGAGNNLTINTKNYTSIESSNIYLGKQAREKVETEGTHAGKTPEPLVLGEQLRLILEEIIGILEVFKVTGVQAGISGTASPDVSTKIGLLKDKLSNPAFFSEYHFIEDNGQKATKVKEEET